MKLVCSNRKWQGFERKGLAPYHARVPPFPLQIHAQKVKCRDWGPGRPYQVLSCLHAVIYTFLVNEWTFFFFGYILIAKIVVKILPRQLSSRGTIEVLLGTTSTVTIITTYTITSPLPPQWYHHSYCNCHGVVLTHSLYAIIRIPKVNQMLEMLERFAD